ncbi:MAG: polysaccharide biosynthesis C-terminal domain-containing protein [Ruminococcus sp.]|nr:polysaccharide biosynthesis C-terminal domain-containing protein [Ruminococcus sp.]MDE6785388.1 polysaccharide biosynthesis C-terminal domain-containing protein [Ruminococcus sp.]
MNKYKKLAFNTIIFAVGSFGSKILVILLTSLYTSYIPPSGMGVKEMLETTALFLQPIFTFALQEYLIRFGLDKNYDKREVFTTSAVITTLGFIAVAVIVPLLRFIPFLSFINGYTLLLILYTCISSLRMLCAQFVRSRDMVKLFSLDGILATLSLFVFNYVFIAVLGMGVKGFMLAVILSDLSSSIFLFGLAGLKNFLHVKFFKKSLAKEMMKFALPLIPTIVMWTVTSLSDRLFISYMKGTKAELGLDAAGLYGVANKIPNLISMVSTIFFQAWNMSAISENESSDRSSFYERVYSAYESVLFIAAAGLMLFIKPITNLLINSDNFEEYGRVYMYTPVLIIAVVFMALNQFLGGIYTVTKHTLNSFTTSATACLVNLLLNFILIPELGIQGAALATFLSYFLCFWVRIIDARYYVPFKFNGIISAVDTGLLFAMCAIIIASPKGWVIWLAIIFCVIAVMNFRPMLETVKKVLKRG